MMAFFLRIDASSLIFTLVTDAVSVAWIVTGRGSFGFRCMYSNRIINRLRIAYVISSSRSGRSSAIASCAYCLIATACHQKSLAVNW